MQWPRKLASCIPFSFLSSFFKKSYHQIINSVTENKMPKDSEKYARLKQAFHVSHLKHNFPAHSLNDCPNRTMVMMLHGEVNLTLSSWGPSGRTSWKSRFLCMPPNNECKQAIGVWKSALVTGLIHDSYSNVPSKILWETDFQCWGELAMFQIVCSFD